jgi:DNA-binding CsgD family transcriptional regulator
MHKLNVIIFGPKYFLATLIELKSYLKFNLEEYNFDPNKKITNYDIVILHKDILTNKDQIKILKSNKPITILASDENNKLYDYDSILNLPTSVNEINSIVEQLSAKKIFNKNSSILIKKEYVLDKNEKKLIKNNNFIILTEKEIQLLELFLSNSKPISKKEILLSVWNYSKDADTHTVETHIYRLRKKINDKFLDTSFIANDKNGYYL